MKLNIDLELVFESIFQMDSYPIILSGKIDVELLFNALGVELLEPIEELLHLLVL